MIETYIIGILGIVGLMVAWVVIQHLWKHVFSEHISDEDALAERTRCTNCGCTTVCENMKSRQTTWSGQTTATKPTQLN